MSFDAFPDLYRQHVECLVRQAVRQLEAGEPVAAAATMGRLENDQTVVVALDDSDPQSKDASARAVRTAAAVFRADFIFTVQVAWILPPRLMPRHQQLLERYGRVGNVPGAVEALAFMLQAREGTWAATPEVVLKRPSKRRRKLAGPIRFQKVDAVGRNADLLPPAAPVAGATIH